MRCEFVGVGMFKSKDADVAHVDGEFLVETGEQAFDDRKGALGAGDDEGAGAIVDGDSRFVFIAHLVGALARVEIGNNLLDDLRIGVFEEKRRTTLRPDAAGMSSCLMTSSMRGACRCGRQR